MKRVEKGRFVSKYSVFLNKKRVEILKRGKAGTVISLHSAVTIKYTLPLFLSQNNVSKNVCFQVFAISHTEKYKIHIKSTTIAPYSTSWFGFNVNRTKTGPG